MAVPARLFEQFGNWDETVGRKGDARGTYEDAEFEDRVRNAGGAVWFCPAATVYHRVPRASITPRQVTSIAFTRGRNHLWNKHVLTGSDVSAIPKRNLIGGLFLLTASVLRWSFWATGFRCRQTKRRFEHARQAAFSTGHHLDSLRPGRDSSRLFNAVNHLAFRVRNLLLRLSPDLA
jgi:GT2 family glycosyltransferase